MSHLAKRPDFARVSNNDSKLDAVLGYLLGTGSNLSERWMTGGCILFSQHADTGAGWGGLTADSSQLAWERQCAAPGTAPALGNSVLRAARWRGQRAAAGQAAVQRAIRLIERSMSLRSPTMPPFE